MTNDAEDKQQTQADPAPDKQQDETPCKEEEERSKKLKPRKKNERANKIYRTPPSPDRSELFVKEKSFILDCNATSSISKDYSLTNPKLGPVLPPYNSQRDKHVRNYFRFSGVSRTLKRTGQYNEYATSIEGAVSDKFHEKGAGFTYLSLRNRFGAGHSQETVDGHSQFMQGIRGVSGYNGQFGFRRNTPWLRKAPTPFGIPIIFPTN